MPFPRKIRFFSTFKKAVINCTRKKSPTNFTQTVECIVGRAAEFTTLYNGQLLLLRLLYITITTKIDALRMIGYFSLRGL